MSKDFSILKQGKDFRYQLLDRMRMDCEYYLGNGNRSSKHLWAENEKTQIENMKILWNSFAADEKPTWLSYEKILEYEKQMIPEISHELYAVGNEKEFAFIPVSDIEGIKMDSASVVRFKGINWNLFEGMTYGDCQKINSILSNYEKYSTNDHLIEPVVMQGEIEIVIPGFDENRDPLFFGAYSFICDGKEIPVDFSGSSWNIEQEGDKISISFDTGRTALLTDCFLDDCYESDYSGVGLRINDITAEFLSNTTSISEFMLSMELNGEELGPEDIAERGSFKIKALSFSNYNEEYIVPNKVLEDFNDRLNKKKSLSSMIESAENKTSVPLHTNSRSELEK